MTPYYYVREIEKILIALMDVFNNIRVNKYKDLQRKDYDRTIAVPIVTHSNANFANYVSSTLTTQDPMPVPIIGFRFTSNSHDDANMVQPCYAREILSPSLQKFIRDIQPTPFVFNFEMTVLSNNWSDYVQMKEQIEPYFNTYRAVRIKEFDFAPEIERPIPFKLASWSEQIDDEKQNTSNEYQFYKTTYNIEAHGVMHRPYEIPAIIKYAQMNFNVNNEYIDSLQVFVYPDEIAKQKKHLWETIEPSIREGWSLLKSFTRTLVRKTDEDDGEYWKDVTMKHYDLTKPAVTEYESGNPLSGYNPILKGYEVDENGQLIKDDDGEPIPIYDWEEIVVGDVNRPVEVPSFDLIRLNFDEDTSLEHDFSGLNRDFVAVNPESREFVPDLPPGNGNYTPDGYRSDTNWSQILEWFGDNKEGKIESSYTFKATLQFKNPDADTVFQYLYNPEDVELPDGTVIPKETVWFDWGIQDKRLYFTYHTSSQYHRFTSAKLELDDITIYSFYFVLYNEGQDGAFGVRTNFSETMLALETKEL